MIILTVIISISILILVHELGHFLAAKLFKVRVDEFGLGFPPKIVSKKFGETTYSLNVLPFGGFVKIHGEDGSEPNSDRERSFVNRPIWQRSLIVLAGIFMNIILGWIALSIVFMIGSAPHLAITDVANDS